MCMGEVVQNVCCQTVKRQKYFFVALRMENILVHGHSIVSIYWFKRVYDKFHQFSMTMYRSSL